MRSLKMFIIIISTSYLTVLILSSEDVEGLDPR